jgi:hypothetical protein
MKNFFLRLQVIHFIKNHSLKIDKKLFKTKKAYPCIVGDFARSTLSGARVFIYSFIM